MKTFRLAHCDYVQASIREFNHEGIELEYRETCLGFEVIHKNERVATVAFWGTQPAIRVESDKLKSSALMIGEDAVDVAGELVMLLVRQHHAK